MGKFQEGEAGQLGMSLKFVRVQNLNLWIYGLGKRVCGVKYQADGSFLTKGRVYKNKSEKPSYCDTVL